MSGTDWYIQLATSGDANPLNSLNTRGFKMIVDDVQGIGSGRYRLPSYSMRFDSTHEDVNAC